MANTIHHRPIGSEASSPLRFPWPWLMVVAASLAPIVAWGQADDWPMERLWVKGGREYRGLLLNSTHNQVEFAEIVRPRGKPMYAIIRALPKDDVVEQQGLPPAERAKLEERFDAFRNRALVEAGKMEAVHLVPLLRDGVQYQVYDGPWFTMWSTADDETTRRSIVRIEQSFRAYRQLLPPRIEKGSSFQIYLYGSTIQYRAAQERWGIESGHPAFYALDRNIVVAGTDLDRFAQELRKSQQENERTRQQLKSLRRSHDQTLAQVSSDMRRAGFAADEIESEIRSRRAAWKAQQDQLEAAIDEAAKRNAARFEEVARSMFRRLNHEAFHAYLENYVYPHDQFDLPRWLNEGLAQIFENAQLDADTLRIDAPTKDLLARLQVDLKGNRPLPLAELLSNDESLVAVHRVQRGTQRRYLYAWGLAYYLAFQQGRLNSPGFEGYVARGTKDPRPIERFERWTTQSLSDFENQWRRDMLELR